MAGKETLGLCSIGAGLIFLGISVGGGLRAIGTSIATAEQKISTTISTTEEKMIKLVPSEKKVVKTGTAAAALVGGTSGLMAGLVTRLIGGGKS